MDIQIHTLIKRIFSFLILGAVTILFSLLISKIIPGAITFGQFSLFMHTAWIIGILLSFGQHRLIFILINTINKQNYSFVIRYLRFIILLTLALTAVLFSCKITLFIFPSIIQHPSVMGVLLAPLYTLGFIAISLLNKADQPILGRFCEVFSYALAAIILYGMFIFKGPLPYTAIAFALALSYAVIALLLIIYCIEKIIKKQGHNLFTTLTEKQALSKPNAGYFINLLYLKLNYTKSERKQWVIKGLSLCTAEINDNLFSVGILLSEPMGLNLTDIACCGLAFTVFFALTFSQVIRNHFNAMLLLQLPQTFQDPISQTCQTNIKRIKRSVWVTNLISLALCIALAIAIETIYGPQYKPAGPLLIFFSCLMFVTNGWSISRCIFIHYQELNHIFKNLQSARLILTLLLLPLLIHYFASYGLFLALGLPSLLTTLAQLIIIRKTISINLLY